MADGLNLPTMTLNQWEARDAGLFLVPLYAKADAEAAFAKLGKRAVRRLGSEAPRLEWVAQGEWKRTWIVDNGDREEERSRMVPALYARIIGQSPKIAGWELAARLIVTETNERMLKVVPTLAHELPSRFRDTGVECEHCKKIRGRKDVFVVYNSEKNEWLQVGRTCLRDFLGHDPARLLLAFTIIATIGNSFNGSFYTHPCFDTQDVLGYTAASIRIDGWRSRTLARAKEIAATADDVGCALGRGTQAAKERIRLMPSPQDQKIAGEALEWVREVVASKPSLNDYEHNLVISLKHPVVDVRSLGVACSAIQAFLCEMSRQEELNNRRKANLNSNYVGVEKERLHNLKATVEFTKFIESDFGGCLLIKFRTAEGNLMSWFSSGRSVTVKPGDGVVLTGTVKTHKEYNGVKETQLSRCKMELDKAA